MFYYTESDFARRKTFPKYELYKTIENLCIECNSVRPNLKSYIVCPGVLYGHGEIILYK